MGLYCTFITGGLQSGGMLGIKYCYSIVDFSHAGYNLRKDRKGNEANNERLQLQ